MSACERKQGGETREERWHSEEPRSDPDEPPRRASRCGPARRGPYARRRRSKYEEEAAENKRARRHRVAPAAEGLNDSAGAALGLRGVCAARRLCGLGCGLGADDSARSHARRGGRTAGAGSGRAEGRRGGGWGWEPRGSPPRCRLSPEVFCKFPVSLWFFFFPLSSARPPLFQVRAATAEKKESPRKKKKRKKERKKEKKEEKHGPRF